MAHNAYISRSPQRAPQSSSETTCGIRFESQKAWIYASEPAVMLETAQHVSVRMLSLGDCSKPVKFWSAPLSSTHWVWAPVPVTVLPTVRSAGVITLVFL